MGGKQAYAKLLAFLWVGNSQLSIIAQRENIDFYLQKRMNDTSIAVCSAAQNDTETTKKYSLVMAQHAWWLIAAQVTFHGLKLQGNAMLNPCWMKVQKDKA